VLTLYNSLTRRKEAFTPLDLSHVRMYVCGPTVYDRAHLGNARPVVVFDVLCRLLKRLYPRVTYVRNITDVDDKINAAAKARGLSIAAITEETIQNYHGDMKALGALPPDVEPRATAHIPHMIAMIKTLMAKGFAYERGGHVLFRVSQYGGYGALSRRSVDELLAGARVEVAPYKENPGDFVLWKPSSADLPGWESPWGRGRPGWHIECSAMSAAYVGETFDIHGGGIDLIFPHHENEVAQSCCAHGTARMANYWLHNGHLMVEGAKMSKSLGNFLTVEDLLRQHHGETIRVALLMTHYRQPLDWRADVLVQAKATLDRYYTALQPIFGKIAIKGSNWDYGEDSEREPGFNALCDDLNTPRALSEIHSLITHVNTSSPPQIAASRMRMLAEILGFGQLAPDMWFKGGMDEATWIEEAIAARKAARERRDFAESDRIRNELTTQGIVLEDSPGGTTWRRY
jgi:cysteinyl-tRNA synthetase